MVTILRELFAASRHPSHDAKESAAQVLASLIEQAQAIGHAHAVGEEQRGMAWGGKFANALSSAWDIVNTFVQRIMDWMAGQDPEDLDEEAIQSEVDRLSETVSSVEIPTAIEGAVMDGLQQQGALTIRWLAQPGACPHCQDNADMGSMPIGTDFNGDTFPPAHAHCRCSLALGEE